MGITSSRFNSKGVISGIKFSWSDNDKFTVLGYYISPEYKDKSEYNYQTISEIEYKNMNDIHFEPGCYLKNIIREIDNGSLKLVFQTENYLGNIKPVEVLLELKTKTMTVSSDTADIRCDTNSYVNQIKIQKNNIHLECIQKKQTSTNNMKIYLFILFIIVVVISGIYYRYKLPKKSYGGFEPQLKSIS
jgi:hypothetical protein